MQSLLLRIIFLHFCIKILLDFSSVFGVRSSQTLVKIYTRHGMMMIMYSAKILHEQIEFQIEPKWLYDISKFNFSGIGLKKQDLLTDFYSSEAIYLYQISVDLLECFQYLFKTPLTSHCQDYSPTQILEIVTKFFFCF